MTIKRLPIPACQRHDHQHAVCLASSTSTTPRSTQDLRTATSPPSTNLMRPQPANGRHVPNRDTMSLSNESPTIPVTPKRKRTVAATRENAPNLPVCDSLRSAGEAHKEYRNPRSTAGACEARERTRPGIQTPTSATTANDSRRHDSLVVDDSPVHDAPGECPVPVARPSTSQDARSAVPVPREAGHRYTC